MNDNSESRNAPLHSRKAKIGLQHLQYAVAAADYGSFRRAAEALLIRQSTLSRCIRQLEHLAGIVVFERSSGGVRATEAGRNFLRLARSVLEQMDSLVATAHRASRGEVGRITIGFYTSLSTGNLRATLIDYAQRFPGIEIAMVEGSRARLVTALRNGAIDVAIVTGEMPFLDNDSMLLWSERILVALPEGHQLATNESIYWTDLRGQTLLLGQRDLGSEMQDLLIAKLVLPEDRPKIVCHDVSRESIKSLIDAGFGIGLAIEASLGADFGGVIHREVRDGLGPTHISHSANWRKDNDNPALVSLLTLLRERYPARPT